MLTVGMTQNNFIQRELAAFYTAGSVNYCVRSACVDRCAVKRDTDSVNVERNVLLKMSDVCFLRKISKLRHGLFVSCQTITK